MKEREEMKMEAYEAPTVEVIEVAVEKGFAGSGVYDGEEVTGTGDDFYFQ